MKRTYKYKNLCLVLCVAFVLSFLPNVAEASAASTEFLSENAISSNVSLSDTQIGEIDTVSSFDYFKEITSSMDTETALKGMITSLLVGKIQVENSYMDIPLTNMLAQEVLASDISATEQPNDPIDQEVIPSLEDTTSQEDTMTLVQDDTQVPLDTGVLEPPKDVPGDTEVMVPPNDNQELLESQNDGQSDGEVNPIDTEQTIIEPEKNIPVDMLTNDNLLFFVQKAQLFGAMRKDAGIVITDEQLDYEFSPVTYTGDKAIVDVTEYYSFQIDAIDVRSHVNTDYHITLVKGNDGSWSIDEITSNDWFDAWMNYEPFDVDKMLAEMDGSVAEVNMIEEPNAESVTPTIAASNAVRTLDYTIDANRLANYADTFWSSYNTGLYDNFNGARGGDCMNFASQCLAVGLGFSSDSTSITNGNAPCDNVGTHTWIPKKSEFISCSSFANYLEDNTTAGETGLEGTVVERTSQTYTYKAGDILHVDNGKGTPFAHAAIVTRGGSAKTALVSAHNNDRHNVTIAFMWNTSDSIKLCRITGYYTYSDCAGHTYSNPSVSSNGTDSTCNKCGYSKLRIDADTFAPLTVGSTKTITASTSTRCYRIAVGITTPSKSTTWLPAQMNSSSFSSSYKFSEKGIYTVVVSARDLNDSLVGSYATSFTYQVRVE